MMGEATHKTAIVTGGSRGIGRATSLRLAASGFNVALVARHGPDLAATVASIRELGHVASGYVADVTDDSQVESMAHDVRRDLGPASVLVNSAGGTSGADFRAGSLRESKPRDLLRAVAHNTVSILRCSQAVLPHFDAVGGGCIVNVLSILADRQMRGLGSYAAAKAAALSLTRTMALEWAPRVRVNAVLPGHTETADDEQKRSEAQWAWLLDHVAMGRRATPEEIAGPIAFMCSDDASFLTGAALEIHGGSTNWCRPPDQ